MPTMTEWKKIQAVSGLTFGIFLALHLACHFSLNLGWETGHAWLLALRKIYQHPVVEVGVFVAAFTHMASNGVIYLKRSKIAAVSSKGKDDEDKAPKAGSTELKFHRYTGYFIAGSFFGHVFATRVAPLVWFDDPSVYDYTFLSLVMGKVPNNFFTVYLYILGTTGIWHLAYGTYSALATLSGSSVVGKRVPQALILVAAVAGLLMLSTILAIKGGYYKIDFETKAAQHQLFLEILGI